MKNIIDTCNKINDLIPYLGSLSDEDNTFLYNFNIELAKSIINDMDKNNARQIAKNYPGSYRMRITTYIRSYINKLYKSVPHWLLKSFFFSIFWKKQSIIYYIK